MRNYWFFGKKPLYQINKNNPKKKLDILFRF